MLLTNGTSGGVCMVSGLRIWGKGIVEVGVENLCHSAKCGCAQNHGFSCGAHANMGECLDDSQLEGVVATATCSRKSLG